jgi:Protein of unknown function (DUF1515)
VSDEILIKMSESLGRIEQKVDGTLMWMTKHVADDKVMADDIKALQLVHARQSGALKVWGIVGSALGAGLGYVIERITLGHR